MFDYEEFCPISKTAMILGERWTIQIIREMHFGASHFSDFNDYLPRLSPSLLKTRLQTLEDNGVIFRKRLKGKKGYEYLLTPSGKALLPVILEMGKWGVQHSYDTLRAEELDAKMLVRDIAVYLDQSQLPDGNCILRFNFRDLDDNPSWYIRIQNGNPEICSGVPDMDIEIFISTTLEVMTKVWMGSIKMRTALEDGRLRVEGNPIYTRNISRWLRLSQFAKYNPGYDDAPTGNDRALSSVVT